LARGLTPEHFEKLLECLGPDRDTAAARYEHFRRALITFFQFRGSRNPDEDADTVFDRVGRRLSEGHEIFTSNPINYFYAVARNVWREWLASSKSEIPLEEDLHFSVQRTLSPLELLEVAEQERSHERWVSCLEACLQNLETRERELIIAYYQGTGRAKIENRQTLATQLNIPLSTLRVRACRLRDKLEKCVGRCLKHQP
jgi:RNA polymerase sigma factor (sigma-70 family)